MIQIVYVDRGPLKIFHFPVCAGRGGWVVVTASGPPPQKASSFLKETLASLNLTSCAHFTDKPNVAPRKAETGYPEARSHTSLWHQGEVPPQPGASGARGAIAPTPHPHPRVEERRELGGPGGKWVLEEAHPALVPSLISRVSSGASQGSLHWKSDSPAEPGGGRCWAQGPQPIIRG